MNIKKRKIYFIGAVDRMNNSWHFSGSGLSESEAFENFKQNKVSYVDQIGYEIKKRIYIEHYSENSGWDIKKVIEGWC